MITSTIFNPVTGNKRTISLEVEIAYLQGFDPPTSSFYIKGTTNAVDLNGNTVGPFYLTSLSNLPDTMTNNANGTHQHPNGSTSPFTNLTLQINNWTRRLIEGDSTSTPVFVAMSI